MKRRKNGFGTRFRQIGTGLAGVVLAAGRAAASPSLSATTSSSGSTAGSGGGAATTSSCGTAVAVGPKNPDGVYSSLSPELKKIYTSYPDDLIASPWATTKITAKPPWKIGYVAFAITNPYNQHVLDGLKQQFADAKAAGLVTGSLVTNIPATMAASTAEQQISAIQQMVRQRVNAIILLPGGSVGGTPATQPARDGGAPR